MTSDNSTIIKASIVGATGYLGGEVIRLLLNHPLVKIKHLTSNSSAGMPVFSFHPTLRNVLDMEFEHFDYKQVAASSDVVFCAAPHGAALDVVAGLLKENSSLKVIDLSADFRIRDAKTYQEWYNTKHTQTTWLKNAVYGMPEFYYADIAKARLLANPGCYPTSAILALAPLLKAGAADPNNIVIDSKSGASGAGRSLSQQTHYPECNENLKAYAVASHRHTPEIEQELSIHASSPITVNFTPHLIPINRGILTTVYCTLKKSMKTEELSSLYVDAYEKKPFVRMLEQGTWPETRFVRGTNFCDIQVTIDKRTGKAIIVSAIDNLIKGGAGQAIQNMNIMFGLKEDLGLNATGVCI